MKTRVGKWVLTVPSPSQTARKPTGVNPKPTFRITRAIVRPGYRVEIQTSAYHLTAPYLSPLRWGEINRKMRLFFVCYFSHLYVKKTLMNPDLNCCTFVFLFLDFVCCCFSEGVGGYFQTLIMGGLPLLKIQPCDASIHLLLIQCPVNLILSLKNTPCSFVKSSAEARMRRTRVAQTIMFLKKKCPGKDIGLLLV